MQLWVHLYIPQQLRSYVYIHGTDEASGHAEEVTYGHTSRSIIFASSKMVLLFDNRSALLEVAKDRKVMHEPVILEQLHSTAASRICQKSMT
jgi:hypothetical protein